MARKSIFSNYDRPTPTQKSVGERFDGITKTEWAEAYADLYRFFRRSPQSPVSTVMDDAEYRVKEIRRKAAKGGGNAE